MAPEHGAEVMDLGAIGTRQGAIEHLIRQMPSHAKPLIGVHEAGPGGSWLSRYLTHTGDDGGVVAPAVIPTPAGDRVNTDRRAAVPLARWARSGDLTAGDGPTVDADAMRARTRARADARSGRQAATCRLHAFVLRQASRSVDRAHGGPAHLRWLAAGVCPTPAPPSVLPAEVRAVHAPTDRRQRLDQARQAHVQAWRVHPVVEARPAWRGVPCTGAVTLVADIGARTRVDHPRERMTGVGLMPADDAAGAPRRQGAITNAGHTPARRALVEGAWADRSPAQGSRPLPRRRAPPPTSIQDLRGKA